jgi:guanylate kinase
MTMYPQPGPQSLFLVLSGPSGAGKSTVIQRFLKANPGFIRCLSVTTRAPRGMERDGVDYFFNSDEEFSRKVGANQFLEHAVVFGKHHYGTPRTFVEENLRAGRSVIKDVDVQGALRIRQTFPAAVQVFVVPPSRVEIERRLRGRATDDEDTIRRRLEEADAELAQWDQYDYVIFNDVLDQAVADLSAIVRAEQLVAPGRR